MRYIRKFILIIMVMILGLFSNATTYNKDSSNTNPVGQTIIPFNFQDIKQPSISVKPSVSYPGDTILIEASAEGFIEFNGKGYKLSPSQNCYLVFLPISIDQKPGEYPIYFLPENKNNLMNEFMLPNIAFAMVAIKEKEFSTQYLQVTKLQEEMYYNYEKIVEDRKKFNAAMSQSTVNPLFNGSFLQPLHGRVSTMYGYTRYINGVLDSRHLAIDIASPEGTPIIAPNNGNVVLADFLYLSGNRVIIDHGANLFSSFSHMSKLNVKVGNQVKKGDIIGWVGSTGFSTGPHLHHAFYVHGEAVNPELFFGMNPFNW